MFKNRHQKHLKIGDRIKIISGYHKGKTGKIKKFITKKNKVIIEDHYLITKHIKPQKDGEKGQINKIERPIHISNVILYIGEKNTSKFKPNNIIN